MRNRKQLSFDRLEGKRLLSPGDPLYPTDGLTEQERLQYELILQQQQANVLEAERLELEDFQRRVDAVFPVIPPPTPPVFFQVLPPEPEPPSIWESYLNAIDAAIQAISPPNHPIMITP